ncbi:hypothetical protein BLOT_005907, partial [Blomia tropicalis]
MDDNNEIENLILSVTGMLKNFIKTDLSKFDNFERYRAVFSGREELFSGLSNYVKNFVSAKDETEAKNYRERGNSAYMLKDFHKTFDCYSSAILYSPTNNESSELALAYGNRSAVFFELGKWENCLMDIDFAMSNGYQSYKKDRKLYFRKIECLIALNRFNKARSVLENLPEQQDLNVNSFEDCRIKKFRLQLNCEQVSSLKNENDSEIDLNSLNSVISQLQNFKPSKNFPSISSKLEIKYNEALKGRLVAKEDISPGEIIIIESPASCVLMKKYEHSYCHHCHVNVKCNKESMTFFQKVACDHCTNVIFCSPNCRTMAQKYHKFECLILPILHKMYKGHVAFRLLVTTKIETIRKVVETYNKKQTSLISSESENEFSRYMQIYQLVVCSDTFDQDELLYFTITAGFLARLASYSRYISKRSEFFIGGVLMRHLLQLVTNLKLKTETETASIYDNIPEVNCHTNVEHISAAIFSMSSLLQNSCNPNVFCSHVHGFKNIVIATKEIPLGSDIHSEYDAKIVTLNYKERISEIKKSKYEKCNCHRCELELKDGFEDYYPILCSEKRCKEKKLPLTRPNSNENYFLCPNCKHKFTKVQIQKKYREIQSCFGQIKSLMEPNDGSIVPPQLNKIKNILEVLEEMVCNDQSCELGILYDKMCQFYHKMGNWEESIFYLNKYMAYIKKSFAMNIILYRFYYVFFYDKLYGTKSCSQELKTKIRTTFESTIKFVQNFADIHEKLGYKQSRFLKTFKGASELLPAHSEMFECLILPILHKMYKGHIAFRLLATTKIETIRKVVETYNKKQTSLYELLNFTITAGFLARLASYSRYTSKNSEFFIGGVVSGHLLQLVTNLKLNTCTETPSIYVHNITEQPYCNTKVEHISATIFFNVSMVGKAIKKMSSLLQNSCNPSVFCSHVHGFLNIIIATKEIPLRSDIHSEYDAKLVTLNYKERSSEIKKSKYGKCTCHRCELELKDGFEDYYLRLPFFFKMDDFNTRFQSRSFEDLIPLATRMLKNFIKTDLSKLDNFERYRAVFSGREELFSGLSKDVKNFVSAKDETEAKNYRERGNSAYMHKDFHKAFDCYSSAILHSPINNESSELALAFGNRSAVFFELGKWENCLMDIDFAMSNGYQSYKKDRKLYFRKIECLIALNRFNEARSVLEMLPEQQDLNVNSFEDGRIKKFRLQLNGSQVSSLKNENASKINLNSLNSVITKLQNFKPSQNFPSISSKLEIKYNEALEGRVVAKEDINPGEMIIIESPVASVLMKKYEHSYCHHCHVNVKCNKEPMTFFPKVGCDHCTNVIFCSPNCRTMAQKYHKFECLILPILHKMYKGHIAFRLLVTTKIETIRKVVEAFNKKQTSLISSESENDFSRYMQIYQLVCSDTFDQDELLYFTITAGFLARLASYSRYISKRSEFFIGGVLLRHLLQLFTNLRFNIKIETPSIYDYNITEVYRHTEVEHISAAIFSMSSLLQKSCNPNVFCDTVHGSLSIIIATKEIPLGSDIHSAYDAKLVTLNYKERSSVIKKSKYGKCTCHRCELELKDGFEDYYPILCSEKRCKEKKLPLTRPNSNENYFLCPNCKHKFTKVQIQEKYREIQSCFGQINSQIKSLIEPKYGSIVPPQFNKIKNILEVLEEMVCNDQSCELGILYDKMCQFYHKMGNMEESISYLNKFMDYNKKSFGSYSPEYFTLSIRLCNFYKVLCGTKSCSQELKTKIRTTFESTIKLLKNFADIHEKLGHGKSPFLKNFKRISGMFQNLKENNFDPVHTEI